MTAALAAIHNGAGVVWFLALVLVFGCLVAAAFAAWHNAWVAAAALVLVAVVAAVLLL